MKKTIPSSRDLTQVLAMKSLKSGIIRDITTNRELQATIARGLALDGMGSKMAVKGWNL